jgi:putative PIN family toxin of toxin-antitoxin system
MSRRLQDSPPTLRVAFDTNIYIAALLRPGLSEELVRRGLRGDFLVVISPEIISELTHKLKTKFALPTEKIQKYLELISLGSETFLTQAIIEPRLRDQQDLAVLACAHAGMANLIITLDQDLLVLKEWKGIALMHPKSLTWIIPEIQ